MSLRPRRERRNAGAWTSLLEPTIPTDVFDIAGAIVVFQCGDERLRRLVAANWEPCRIPIDNVLARLR